MNAEPILLAWFDPGKTTGVAWCDLEQQTFRSTQFGEDDLEQGLTTCFASDTWRAVFGYEKYIQTPGATPGTKAGPSEKAIGVICSYARTHGIPVLDPVPSSARNLGRLYLKRMGWHKPGQEHANDAARHLLAHLLSRKPMPQQIRSKLFPGYTAGVTIAP